MASPKPILWATAALLVMTGSASAVTVKNEDTASHKIGIDRGKLKICRNHRAQEIREVRLPRRLRIYWTMGLFVDGEGRRRDHDERQESRHRLQGIQGSRFRLTLER